jgi:hypothetical protein
MSMDSFFVEVLNVVGQMGISLGVTGRKDWPFHFVAGKGSSGLDDHMSPVKCHA